MDLRTPLGGSGGYGNWNINCRNLGKCTNRLKLTSEIWHERSFTYTPHNTTNPNFSLYDELSSRHFTLEFPMDFHVKILKGHQCYNIWQIVKKCNKQRCPITSTFAINFTWNWMKILAVVVFWNVHPLWSCIKTISKSHKVINY